MVPTFKKCIFDVLYNVGIIRGKVVFIGDYSMKPRLINRLKAEAKPRPFNVLSTEAE